MQGVDENLLVEPFDGRRRRGDVLDVHEQPAGRQQIENLAVDRAFARVGLVMDRIARDDDVERRVTGDGRDPACFAVVGVDHGRPRRHGAKLAARKVEHLVGKVGKDAGGAWEPIEHRTPQDAVAAAEIEHARGLGPRPFDQPEHDGDLLVGLRDRAAHAVDVARGEARRLPALVGPCHERSANRASPAIATPPSAPTIQTDAPSSFGAPATVNGAVSNTGAMAR